MTGYSVFLISLFFLALSVPTVANDLISDLSLPEIDLPASNTIGLTEVYQTALKRNETLANAQEGYLQSVYLKKQITAAILPDVTFQGNYFQQEEIQTTGLAGQSFLLSTRKTYFARIEQTLFNGFQERNGYRQANFLIQAGEANVRRTRDELLLEVATAFYDSLKLQKEIETLEESLRLQKERLREIQARQKVGLARRTEVLLIETQVANDESQLIRARNGLQIAREQLNFVVGETVTGTLIDDITEVVTDLNSQLLLRKAIAQRPDVKESQWQVEAAKSNVSVVRGEYWPEIELNSNIYGRREGIQSPVTWDFEVAVSIPLFFGRDTRAKELQALSRMRQAELSYQQLERRVELDIETSILEWQSSDALIETLRKEADLADENYRLIQEEYRIGLATNLEVLTAYNFLQNAKLELEKEKINRKLVWIRLQTAVGENPALKERKL